MYRHAVSQVHNAFSHFLHFGVLHDKIPSFILWIGDEIYELADWHAELVPMEPIPVGPNAGSNNSFK